MMMTIEYTVRKRGHLQLHVARPTSDATEDGQHVVAVTQSRKIALACVENRAAYDALMSCLRTALSATAERLNAACDDATHVEGGVREEFRKDGVIVVVTRSRGAAGNINIVRVFPANCAQVAVPANGQLTSAGLDLELNDSELEKCAQLFSAVEEAKFAPLIASTIPAWFIPPMLSHPDVPEIGATADAIDLVLNHLQTAMNHRFYYTCCEYLGGFLAEAPPALAALPPFSGWLSPVPSYRKQENAPAVGTFYSVGKDQAFAWMAANPAATQAELVDMLMEETGTLPANVARRTAEKIAARVFEVGWDNRPQAAVKTAYLH